MSAVLSVMASFVGARIDHVLRWRAIETLGLTEPSTTPGVFIIDRGGVEHPRTGGILHVLPRARIAIVYLLSGQLTSHFKVADNLRSNEARHSSAPHAAQVGCRGANASYSLGLEPDLRGR